MSDSKKRAPKRQRVEVHFDPDARREFLTGFSKRKQLRRQFGLAMQEIKDRKEKLETRKEKREATKERFRELGVKEDLSAYDIKNKAREDSKVKPGDLRRIEEFQDEHTQGMFGDLVTVTTVIGIPESDEDDGGPPDSENDQDLKAAQKKKSEGTDDRWSLAAVTRRVAANLPKKKKKGGGSGGSKVLGGKQGKREKASASRGSSAGQLLAKAKGSMPRQELGSKAPKAGKKRKRK